MSFLWAGTKFREKGRIALWQQQMHISTVEIFTTVNFNSKGLQNRKNTQNYIELL